MQLIYRGTVIEKSDCSVRAYQQPRAINWRYQPSNYEASDHISIQTYRKPRAINWRWQVAV